MIEHVETWLGKWFGRFTMVVDFGRCFDFYLTLREENTMVKTKLSYNDSVFLLQFIPGLRGDMVNNLALGVPHFEI